MGSGEDNLTAGLKERTSQTFREFMTRVAKLDELGSFGSQLLDGYQQALALLRRPTLNLASELVKNIIKANETKRVKSYIEAGCVNNHDRVQSINKSKTILNELQRPLSELAGSIQTANGCLSALQNDNFGDHLNQQATFYQEETTSSNVEEPQIEERAVLMGIIYSMIKQNFLMQEMIITSLSLKSSSEELESYCLMWSLRPFINDELMHEAWRHIA